MNQVHSPRIVVITTNMRLYYFVVAFFKSRNVPLQSLTLKDEIPSDVQLLITSKKEEPQIKQRYRTIPKKKLRIVGVAVEDQHEIRNQLIRNLSLLLVGKWKEVTLGVDPGIRFGLAVCINGQLIESNEIIGSEDAASLAYRMVEPYLKERIKLRIGNGLLIFVRMFLRSFMSHIFPAIEVELVDEEKSSTLGRLARGKANHTDQAAACIIAQTPGNKIDPLNWVPPIRKHDIRLVQQMSKSVTQGKYTISQDLAKDVVYEKYSLERAIDEMVKREEKETLSLKEK